ncbi:MAG: PASTA domain-containing protein [Crocinitomicaceae bacterium]
MWGKLLGLMEELGLEYEVSESVYDPSKPEGTILFQDPLPTSKSKLAVKSGRTIRIKGFFKIANG